MTVPQKKFRERFPTSFFVTAIDEFLNGNDPVVEFPTIGFHITAEEEEKATGTDGYHPLAKPYQVIFGLEQKEVLDTGLVGIHWRPLRATNLNDEALPLKELDRIHVTGIEYQISAACVEVRRKGKWVKVWTAGRLPADRENDPLAK